MCVLAVGVHSSHLLLLILLFMMIPLFEANTRPLLDARTCFAVGEHDGSDEAVKLISKTT